MKCQILFSGKNKKNVIDLSSAELAFRVAKVNEKHKLENTLRLGPIMYITISNQTDCHETWESDLAIASNP